MKKYTLPIGKKVHIHWQDKTSDWTKYRLLAVDNGLLLLRGRDESDAKYEGNDGWVPLSTIEWMEVDE